MKNWKEQLDDIKRALRGAVSRKKPDEKPTAVDFEPPKSWLADDPSASKRSDGPKGKSHHALNSSKTNHRRTSLHHRAVQVDRTPAQGLAASSAGKSLSEKLPEPSNGAAPPPVFRPHIDETLFLVMPEWSDAGRWLQHPDRRGGSAAPLSVRIGVDFGTAFTKVAIRAGPDLVPVDWSAVTGDESQTGRYVMPGLVVRSSGGEYSWRRVPGSDIQRNLKLPVIEMAGSDQCPTATLAYLALAIRYSRGFLYRHPEVGRKLMARSLRWELNIGCPTEPHEKPEVVQLFRRIARTAWHLAAFGNLMESDIATAWRTADTDVGLETEPGVVPEFVAQIAGYLGSPQVTEGMHALIDIGAATLDVATFNIVSGTAIEPSPRIPIFFSAVRPLGTHYLNHNRHSRLELAFQWDDGAPVESADEFARRNGKLRSEINGADSDFVNEIASCIFGVINGTRTSSWGDPRSPAWREGLPIFVTGGGSDCELYRSAIERVQMRLKQALIEPTRFRFIELDPLGTRVPSFGIEVAARLTVAIGLTEDSENIARVVPHSAIEPITRPVRERVDHTELYGDG